MQSSCKIPDSETVGIEPVIAITHLSAFLIPMVSILLTISFEIGFAVNDPLLHSLTHKKSLSLRVSLKNRHGCYIQQPGCLLEDPWFSVPTSR